MEFLSAFISGYIKHMGVLPLTLSGWVALTANHEKPSVFPGGTLGVT